MPAMRVRPFREIDVPRPSAATSGLFPEGEITPAAPMRPGLPRVVLLTVVVGVVGLLAYTSWQRVARAQAPASTVVAPR